MSDYLSEENSEATVLARLSEETDPRVRKVMEAAIRHLHGFVKEVEPSQEEWAQAIRFLTALGQISDDKRQEWILASDVLGVSMLVDAINHRRPSGATENTVLGPFYLEGAPEEEMGADICRDGKGESCLFAGRVLDLEGEPIAGAKLDVWSDNAEGFYDVQQPGEQPAMNMRGVFTTGADGAYSFRSIRPIAYPIPEDGPVGALLRAMGRHAQRPAHLHVLVSAPGFQTVTSQIFDAEDPYLESDAVFGVKRSLVARYRPGEETRWRADFDFVLARGE